MLLAGSSRTCESLHKMQSVAARLVFTASFMAFIVTDGPSRLIPTAPHMTLRKKPSDASYTFAPTSERNHWTRRRVVTEVSSQLPASLGVHLLYPLLPTRQSCVYSQQARTLAFGALQPSSAIMFHPRGFSPPRRFTPRLIGSGVCNQYRTGFTSFPLSDFTLTLRQGTKTVVPDVLDSLRS